MDTGITGLHCYLADISDVRLGQELFLLLVFYFLVQFNFKNHKGIVFFFSLVLLHKHRSLCRVRHHRSDHLGGKQCETAWHRMIELPQHAKKRNLAVTSWTHSTSLAPLCLFISKARLGFPFLQIHPSFLEKRKQAMAAVCNKPLIMIPLLPPAGEVGRGGIKIKNSFVSQQKTKFT